MGLNFPTYGQLKTIALAPSNLDYIYATYSGIWVTKDNGLNWEYIKTGLPLEVSPTLLCLILILTTYMLLCLPLMKMIKFLKVKMWRYMDKYFRNTIAKFTCKLYCLSIIR